jgi:hypothetical protein
MKKTVYDKVKNKIYYKASEGQTVRATKLIKYCTTMDVSKEGDVLMDACRMETGIVYDNMGWQGIAQSARRRDAMNEGKRHA